MDQMWVSNNSQLFPVMAIPMLLMLFLASLATLSDASCVKDSVSVPGLSVGSRIRFMYTGHDFDRVTLSVVDSIGKSLHLSMRHNFKCKGKAPDILFNTKTNGMFGKSVRDFVDAPELRSGLWWTVTAQETGWLIEQEDIGFSHTYEYHPSHQLSDISGIMQLNHVEWMILSLMEKFKLNNYCPSFQKLLFKSVVSLR